MQRSVAMVFVALVLAYGLGPAWAAGVERPEGTETRLRSPTAFGSPGLSRGSDIPVPPVELPPALAADFNWNETLAVLSPQAQEKLRIVFARSQGAENHHPHEYGRSPEMSPEVLDSAGVQSSQDDGSDARMSAAKRRSAAGMHYVIEGVLADFSLRQLETMPEEDLRRIYARILPPLQLSKPGHPAEAHSSGRHVHGPVDVYHPALIAASKKALKINGALVVVELFGGWMTGSLALMADSMHLAIDAGLAGAPLVSLWISNRFIGKGETYDHGRTEAIIGLVGTGAITLTAAEIAIHAWRHLWVPVAAPGIATILLAFPSLISNAVNSGIFYRHKDRSLSSRAAFLHFVADAVSSMGVIAAGMLALSFEWSWPDPAAGFLIVALIVCSNLGLAIRSWKTLFKSDS